MRRSRSDRCRGSVRWAVVGKGGTDHKRHKRSQEAQKICASCDFLCLLWSIPFLLLCNLRFRLFVCILRLIVIAAHEREVHQGTAEFTHDAVTEKKSGNAGYTAAVMGSTTKGTRN